MTIDVAVEVGSDPSRLQASATATAGAAKAAGDDALWERHRTWWRTIWGQSFVRLSAPDPISKKVEHQWFMLNYLMASSNRGVRPVKFNGGNWLTGTNDARLWGGGYHIYPANAHESCWRVKDDICDMSGLRAVLPLLIQCSERYGMDAQERVDWREFLDHLAPLPRGPSRFSCAERPRSGLRHAKNISCSHMACRRGVSLRSQLKIKDFQHGLQALPESEGACRQRIDHAPTFNRQCLTGARSTSARHSGAAFAVDAAVRRHCGRWEWVARN